MLVPIFSLSLKVNPFILKWYPLPYIWFSQMLLGRKETDPTQEQFRNGTKNAKLIKIDCAGEKFVTTEVSLSRYPDTLLGDPQVHDTLWHSSAAHIIHVIS